MLTLLTNELERCKNTLPHLNPEDEGYLRVLSAINELTYMRDREAFKEDAHGMPDPEHDFADAPAPAPKPEPKPEPTPAPVGEPDAPTLKKEDVRAKLADARLKGVDISKLIASLGAENLSSVDPADYAKLVKMAEDALAEVA